MMTCNTPQTQTVVKQTPTDAVIRIVDDDEMMRSSWEFLLEGEKRCVRSYADALDFIENDAYCLIYACPTCPGWSCKN